MLFNYCGIDYNTENMKDSEISDFSKKIRDDYIKYGVESNYRLHTNLKNIQRNRQLVYEATKNTQFTNTETKIQNPVAEPGVGFGFIKRLATFVESNIVGYIFPSFSIDSYTDKYGFDVSGHTCKLSKEQAIDFAITILDDASQSDTLRLYMRQAIEHTTIKEVAVADESTIGDW